MREKTGKIALNYIYLSEKHAGGKDQVGLNLLKGIYETGITDKIIVICYDYSKKILEEIAPTIEIVTIPSKKKINHILHLYFVNSVIIPKLIRQFNIDVIYHLSINNGLRKFKAKSILTPHDIKQIAHRTIEKEKTPFYKYYPYKLIYYLDFKHADKIIAISDFDKNDINNYYPKYHEKIEKIYNPIVIPDYVEKLEKRRKENIVAINLQFTHKNIITLIKAFELIKDEIEQNLVLIGSISKRVQFLKQYVEEKKLGERVIFTGFLADNQKYRLLINADLYINPSKFEGFGMTAVEAMILKVPTLVSDIPANREVTKGLCQYYKPIEDEKVLAKKILFCLNEKLDKNKLQDNKKQLELEYNYISISKKYLQIFIEEQG